MSQGAAVLVCDYADTALSLSVNDAPALKLADIGISMGKGGTDVAKEAADVILVDDNFATILPAVEEGEWLSTGDAKTQLTLSSLHAGKGIFYNIQNFLSFQLSTAVAALTLITLCTAFGLKLPLNPMQILFINILMDGPPSQSLGVDPVDHAVMRRPPRAKTAPIITKRLIQRILFSASIIVLGTMYVYVHELQDGFADQRDQTMVSGGADRVKTHDLSFILSSQTFTCFVLLDLTSAIQNRGLATPLMGNRMLVGTVSASLVTQLALVYLSPLQGVFQTEGLASGDLFFLFFIAALGYGAHELRRRYERTLGVEKEDEWESEIV